jgi:natural product precursor
MTSLKLNKLNSKILAEKQMNNVYGGERACGCGCCYSNNGGSSSNDNGQANFNGGKYSTGCENTWWISPD